MGDRAMNLEEEIKKILRQNRFLVEREINDTVKQLLPLVSKYISIYIQEEGFQKPF
jgi:hypothetical protein